MRILSYFEANKPPVLSIEVYPPRTDKAMKDLERALPGLLALGPSYMTVTYGALGTTQERTLEVAVLIKAQHGVETASHLTCVGATARDIDRILDRLAASGIENVVALRGDPPKGQTECVAVEGGFSHGNELVGHIRARGAFGIDVAGYPEKHLEAPDFETDIRNRRRKVEAGADIVIAQLFFDNASYFRFVERLRHMGLERGAFVASPSARGGAFLLLARPAAVAGSALAALAGAAAVLHPATGVAVVHAAGVQAAVALLSRPTPRATAPLLIAGLYALTLVGWS